MVSSDGTPPLDHSTAEFTSFLPSTVGVRLPKSGGHSADSQKLCCIAQKFISSHARVRYSLRGMTNLALTELLGATVYDPSGAAGRVREVTIAPQEDRSKVASLIVKTKSGNRVLPFSAIVDINGGIRATTAAGEWAAANGTEGLFLLERDLLDQQVIDVNGRKVVRVNDVDLQLEPQKDKNTRPALRVHSVDVGARGAIRRLLRGVAPKTALQVLLGKIPPRSIPWDFVDVIETDPARRVKLKISHEGLAKLHPADIADIVEELAPDERQAVFQTLDEETAAEALEEVLQVGGDAVLVELGPLQRPAHGVDAGQGDEVAQQAGGFAHGLPLPGSSRSFAVNSWYGKSAPTQAISLRVTFPPPFTRQVHTAEGGRAARAHGLHLQRGG